MITTLFIYSLKSHIYVNFMMYSVKSTVLISTVDFYRVHHEVNTGSSSIDKNKMK